MHTQVSGTQRNSRTLNVISYSKQACKFITTKLFGLELSRTLPYPLNAFFRKQKQNTQNFKNQQLIDVGLNLSDYKFRQENKEKYEKKRLLF